MTILDRRIRVALIFGFALTSMLACDKPKDKAASKDEAPADAKVIDETAAPSGDPAEPQNGPPTEPTKSPIELLAAAAEPSDDPSAIAWTHYKAKDYAKAQQHFAQATLAEPEPWKHPFNLACASALAGDEDSARAGLIEAVARDREATVRKARSDDDLATVRAKPWFEAVLRGEQPSEPAPVEPASDSTPRPKVELTTAQLSSLRAKLEAKHGVKPKIRASLAIKEAGNEAVGWAIYEFSRLDVCVLKSSKQACLKQLKPDPNEFDDSVCKESRMVRARFGAELQIDEPVTLPLPCSITRIAAFEPRDVDADARTEIIVDLYGTRTAGIGMHEDPHTESGRAVRIVRLDGSAQFELSFVWTIMGFAFAGEHAQRFDLIDENGDGHPDLVIHEVDFEGTDALGFDDELWPEPDEDAVGPVTATLRTYLPKTDEWGPPVETDAPNPE